MKKAWALETTQLHTQSNMQQNAPDRESVRGKLAEVQTILGLHEDEPTQQPESRESLNSEASTQIKSLEAALTNIPTGSQFDVARETITAQIVELKRSITKSKPIGTRLETCKAACARSLKRRDTCAEACELAAAALNQAENEYQQLCSDLAGIEREMAMTVSSTTHTDCIEGLATSLGQVLSDMKSSHNIPVEILQQTETHMTSLMAGVRAIALATAPSTGTASHSHQGANTNAERATSVPRSGIRRSNSDGNLAVSPSVVRPMQRLRTKTPPDQVFRAPGPPPPPDPPMGSA